MENDTLQEPKVMDNSAMQLAKNIVQQAQPKFDEVITVEFKYTIDGLWHRVAVNFKEYLDILKSGTVDGRPIVYVEISETTIDNEAQDKVKVIYDFTLLHTGGNPWRLV